MAPLIPTFHVDLPTSANFVYVMPMSDDGHHGNGLYYGGTTYRRWSKDTGVRQLGREDCSRISLLPLYTLWKWTRCREWIWTTIPPPSIQKTTCWQLKRCTNEQVDVAHGPKTIISLGVPHRQDASTNVVEKKLNRHHCSTTRPKNVEGNEPWRRSWWSASAPLDAKRVDTFWRERRREHFV